MKLIRTSTVPESLNGFCKTLLKELQVDEGYEVVAISSPGEELDEIALREGVRTVAVPMQRRISPFKDLLSLFKLIKVFRKEKPQMVHSITPKAGLLSMIAAWICRVPVRLHTFTGLVFPTEKGLKQKILILTDKITCACATHIVPEGEGVKNDLINYKITRKPLSVLGYGNIKGIDLETFDPKSEEVISSASKISDPGCFTFVYVGRLVKDKGINELVEAFVRLNAENANTRLVLVGTDEDESDPLLPETLKMIKKHPCIQGVGRQNDVRHWLLASDVLVHPSYREGFPNVVIEAGAMGLPSIVTDINGSREIITHKENGVIVPPRDSEALYVAMKSALANREDLKRMASNARPMIAKRFEQSFVRRCLKDYYTKILNETIQ